MCNQHNRRLGAVSRQMMVTITLVLVIAASMAYNWSLLFGGSATPPKVVEMGFQCLQCNHEFVTTNEQFQQRTVDMEFLGKHPDRATDMMDCPKCGQKHAATQQIQCPSCSKYYLPSRINVRAAGGNEGIAPPVCPHCGTDLNKWHHEQHPSKD